MQAQNTVGNISLLQAFLVSMVGVALLFTMLALGIWIYSAEVLSREESLVSELLPELDAAYQLTATTAGLQSQSLLLLTSRNSAQLDTRSLRLDTTVVQTLKVIGRLATESSPARTQLEAAVERLGVLTESVVDSKYLQFDLQRQIQHETQTVLALLDRLEKPLQKQVVELTDQLLHISEQMLALKPSESNSTQAMEMIARGAQEFETINLAIQDYLLFGQDIASLTAVIEKLPLLTSIDSVKTSVQSRDLHLRTLVSRSVYMDDEATIGKLLEGLRDLHNLLHRDNNMFELQSAIIAQQLSQDHLGSLLQEPINQILTLSDQLREELRNTVSVQAEQTLTGLNRYRMFLIAVSIVTIVLLGGISYWLLYRKTVQPLLSIIRQLDDVGSDRFSGQVRPYLLKEFSTLSRAISQLNEAQKSMQDKDVQLQGINESLQRVNEELEQFAHVASHDLQEPLRKLQQFSDLLVEDYGSSLDDDGRFFVASIHNSASRMSNLISDTLAYSRAGNAQQTLEPVDLSSLLLQLLDEIDVTVVEAQGNIIVDDLPVVIANRLGMTQLFQNLMINAVKYRQPDTPAQVHISVVNLRDDHDAALVIKVQDNGIGIDDKFLQRIFQPFERLQTEGVRGTGLGLAICRKVCDAHAWGLDVSSTPGVGSIFHIRVPKHSLYGTQ